MQHGARVYLRPLRAPDLIQEGEFFGKLSPESRCFRFKMPVRLLAPDVLRLLQQHSKDPRAAVLVAFVSHLDADEIVGGGRLVDLRRRTSWEIAPAVVDAWQGQGVRTVVLAELMRRARELSYHRIERKILSGNGKMLAIAGHLRMSARTVPHEAGVVTVSRTLRRLPCPNRLPTAGWSTAEGASARFAVLRKPLMAGPLPPGRFDRLLG